MKFTLKDYQVEAVGDVLARLRKARSYWTSEQDRVAFSLTALTGAGKTVMAAAVLEALFQGDDTFNFEADEGAVVVWFSDDPALNEQSRFRLWQASDRLDYSDLVVVQNTFSREKLQPGKVYFLNTQKLGKNSLLVRGHDFDSDEAKYGEPLINLRPDSRSHTIWDTIQNTIEDPRLTLYLVLDEAHRGMGSARAATEEKQTIVKRLINGQGSVPAIPIVLGISATVERFDQAMKGSSDRITLPNVVVDTAKVQDSGLLKDVIVLDVPDEVGVFDTVLVRRATAKIRESSLAWEEYSTEQDDSTLFVKPLMVLQVPNTPDPKEVGKVLDVVFAEWPELGFDAVAHVFGDHSTQRFGSHDVPYISPERVQESTWVRVLIAKDAISTGWDCPRAEVMVSFRPARDRTHITQLLGRMVRTPLARRIPGNDRLNSVDCLLPFFDAKAVTAVASALMNGDDDTEPVPGRRVLIDPAEMTPNPMVPEAVWERFDLLPSQSLPRKGAKPVKRLTALAQELAFDGLLPEAGKLAHSELHKVLDAARARYSDEIAAAFKSVYEVEGRTLLADMNRGKTTFEQFVEEADAEVIEDAYRRAARVLSPDIARTYAEALAARFENEDDDDSEEDALLDAHAQVAALGLVAEVKEYLEAEAEKIAKAWLNEHRVSIKMLSHERQGVYREIKEMSTEPQDLGVVRPTSRMENTKVREADGSERPLPTRTRHLLCDQDGNFPFKSDSGWETRVLDQEEERNDFVAWYRNPPRSSQDSLAIAYEDGGRWKLMRPDFIIFNTLADGSISASIVDPHGHQFSDALPKLKGLAAFAETQGAAFSRIESVAELDGRLRVLDLTSPSVRTAVREAQDAESLYAGAHASNY
ncbi:type III restriction endonuclease subunit R [Micromonospora sp. AMSO12t]|uniref:DEAD/DEAH box helicase n=1 Tax=Micromonospora sp. AMSO12t TaxID=2650410 RepID=UPI00124B3200|nr:DEAD/DEAH box helicase family protein [Micromonospora sp. AMSO12t]KAB1160980.1 type III restriction endonuclease subunit R [Micromonospora sp. AMSO12t]